jgi:glycosyltransferase 2 family protein
VNKHLRFLIFLFITLLILWWFGRGLDLTQIWSHVQNADWRLIVGAVLFVCITYLIRAYRWKTFLAPLSNAPLRDVFAATTVGFSAIFLLGRAGEIIRPAYLPLNNPEVNVGASFITIMVERVYDMSAVIILFALNLIWFNPPGDLALYNQVRKIGLVMLAGAVLGIAILIAFKMNSAKMLSWFNSILNRLPSFLSKIGRAIVGLLEQLAKALSVLVDTRELMMTVGWTTLLWGAIVIANWLVLRAFGLYFGLPETIFVLGGALVGSLMPTPGGGAGAFHAATAGVLIFLGAHREQAWAAATVLNLVVFAPALIFGLYYFLRSDVQFSRLQNLVSTGTAEYSDKNTSLSN